FEEGRAHLGLETQRQWSDRATRRTTPLLFGLYSLVTLFGQALYPDGRLPLKQAAWYYKQAATFGDVLAVVRRHLWGNFPFPTSPTDPNVVLVPVLLFLGLLMRFVTEENCTKSSLAAAASGAAGIMIEVHPTPDQARC